MMTGATVGEKDGVIVGACVGTLLGVLVGPVLGSVVGERDGTCVSRRSLVRQRTRTRTVGKHARRSIEEEGRGLLCPTHQCRA